MLIRDCWIKCRSKTYIAFEGIRLKGSEKIARVRSGECSFSSTIRTNSHIGMICFNLITHRSAVYVSNNINKCWWITNNSHKRQPSSSWSRRGKCANIFSLHNTHKLILHECIWTSDFCIKTVLMVHQFDSFSYDIEMAKEKKPQCHYDGYTILIFCSALTMVARAEDDGCISFGVICFTQNRKKNHARIFDWQNLKIRQIQKYLTQQNPSLVLSNLVKCPSNYIISFKTLKSLVCYAHIWRAVIPIIEHVQIFYI